MSPTSQNTFAAPARQSRSAIGAANCPNALTDSRDRQRPGPRCHDRYPSNYCQILITPAGASRPISRGFFPWRLSDTGRRPPRLPPGNARGVWISHLCLRTLDRQRSALLFAPSKREHGRAGEDGDREGSFSETCLSHDISLQGCSMPNSRANVESRHPEGLRSS